MARRICNMPTFDRLYEVAEAQADSFPSFDLTQLTVKQFDVLVMRYRGDLSLRKIAAFESVHFTSVRDRLAGAMRKLQSQIPYDPRTSRGTATADRIPRTAAGAGDEHGSLLHKGRSGAADAAAGGGGCSTILVSWEELYEQESQADEGGSREEDDPGRDSPPSDSEGTA